MSRPSLLSRTVTTGLAAVALAALTTLAPASAAPAAPASAASGCDPDGTCPVDHFCQRGYLCMGTYATKSRKAKRNDFTVCRREYLSGYVGTGWIVNNQYSPGTAKFYGDHGQYLFSLKAGQDKDPTNVSPIYSVQVC